jgi:hypothetical protein
VPAARSAPQRRVGLQQPRHDAMRPPLCRLI